LCVMPSHGFKHLWIQAIHTKCSFETSTDSDVSICLDPKSLIKSKNPYDGHMFGLQMYRHLPVLYCSNASRISNGSQGLHNMTTLGNWEENHGTRWPVQSVHFSAHHFPLVLIASCKNCHITTCLGSEQCVHTKLHKRS